MKSAIFVLSSINSSETLLRADDEDVVPEIVVRDVGREVDREANAHDEDDHADDVEANTEEGHEPDDAQLHRENSEGDPDHAHLAKIKKPE